MIAVIVQFVGQWRVFGMHIRTQGGVMLPTKLAACRDLRLGCRERRRDERCLRRAAPARPPRPPPQRSAGGRSPRLPGQRHKRLPENSGPLSARARRLDDRVSTG